MTNAPRRALAGSGGPIGAASAANSAAVTAVAAQGPRPAPEQSAPDPSAAEGALAAAETKEANDPHEATEAAAEDVDGALTSGLALAFVDVTEDRERPTHALPTAPVTPPAADRAAAPTVTLRPADATEHVALTAAAPVAGGHARRRSRWRGAGIAVLVLCVLASAGAVAGILTGMIKLPSGGQPAALSASTPSTPTTGAASTPPSPSPSASPTPSPSASTPGRQTQFLFPAVYDPLTAPRTSGDR